MLEHKPMRRARVVSATRTFACRGVTQPAVGDTKGPDILATFGDSFDVTDLSVSMLSLPIWRQKTEHRVAQKTVPLTDCYGKVIALRAL